MESRSLNLEYKILELSILCLELGNSYTTDRHTLSVEPLVNFIGNILELLNKSAALYCIATCLRLVVWRIHKILCLRPKFVTNLEVVVDLLTNVSNGCSFDRSLCFVSSKKVSICNSVVCSVNSILQSNQHIVPVVTTLGNVGILNHYIVSSSNRFLNETFAPSPSLPMTRPIGPVKF